jgi:alpha-N-arabinofuranosidase
MFMYANPVIPGFNPDPSVCRVGDDFYLVTSSFEFFPGVPVYHSKNLVNWELIGYCLTREEQLPLKGCQSSRGIYAPTIRYHDGVFYMTTTNTHIKADGQRYGNFIVHTKDIRGPWSAPAWVDQGGIDPSLLFADGKVFFCSNGNKPEDEKGIYVCEINPVTGQKCSPSRWITKGCGGKCTEAPHIYQINGWYYLLLAEGGTSYGHMAVIQRSRDIYGPYEDCPHNPILSNIKLHRFPIQAIGHADFVEDGQNWWAVCLGVRLLNTQQRHILGRETFLVPVSWKDGWPMCGDNGTAQLQMSGPLPTPSKTPDYDIIEDFSGDKLSLHWNYVRNPDLSRYCLADGCLTLCGGAEGLSDKAPVFMGLRQQSFCIETVAKLRGDLALGTRIGITAFLNESYHYDLALEKRPSGLHILVNRRIHDFEAFSFEAPLPANTGEFELRISSDMDWYYFSYRSGKDWQDAGKAMTAGLCAEGTHSGCFTGVYIGLYASGGEARFAGFSLKNEKTKAPA